VIQAIDNSNKTAEGAPSKGRATNREHELAAEADALAELLLDIYEFRQKSERATDRAAATVDEPREGPNM
jgi:hypothetical protein